MTSNMRAPTIGSSSISAILGLSPWSGPWDVWARIQGLTKFTSNRATTRGHILEPAIANYYGEQCGCALTPGPEYEETPIYGPEPWMHARPDRFAEKDGKEWLVEIKSTRKFNHDWGQTGTPDVPEYYAAQCLWQMALTSHDRTDLAAFATLSDEFRVFTIHRNLKLEKEVVDYARDWYEKHIALNTPPETDGSKACARALSRQFKQASEEFIKASDSDTALAKDLRRLRTKIEEMEVERRLKENLLKERIGEHRGISGICIWTATKPRVTVDSKALKAECPEIYKKYSKVGAASRQFRFIYQPKEQ